MAPASAKPLRFVSPIFWSPQEAGVIKKDFWQIFPANSAA